MSYSHELGVQRKKKFWPHPWGPEEGSKGQISFNFNYKVNFKDFYLRRFSESRSSSGSTPSVRLSVRLSIRLSVRLSVRNTFGVHSLCNLYLQQFSFLYIQILPNDCSYIEDVHLLFCAPLINIFSFFTGVELRHFFHPKCVEGVRFV